MCFPITVLYTYIISVYNIKKSFQYENYIRFSTTHFRTIIDYLYYTCTRTTELNPREWI